MNEIGKFFEVFENTEKQKLSLENQKIKPESGITLKESQEFWDNVFDSAILDRISVEDKNKLGWSEEKIEKKCSIGENGIIQYKTDCQHLEGKCSENGIPYERKIVEINGVKIEGVFPVFHSVFDTELPKELYQSSSGKQFNECNNKLKEAIGSNEKLRQQFTKEQLQDIKNGDTPRGYTWHHNENPGKMQLVKTKDHDRTIGGAAHTGGNSLWGNKAYETKKEGVRF